MLSSRNDKSFSERYLVTKMCFRTFLILSNLSKFLALMWWSHMQVKKPEAIRAVARPTTNLTHPLMRYMPVESFLIYKIFTTPGPQL